MRRNSSATWLALIYALLVAYASLYPFWPWRWPPSLSLDAVLALPWPRYWPKFDLWINGVGYAPLGFLLFAGTVRSGGARWLAVLAACVGPATLSFGLEVLQNFLPSRVPSLADWALNVGGACVGALVAWLLLQLGGLRRWHGWREHWFVPHSAAALALLALWPLGLLFPAPVPLGLGQLLPRVRELATDALAGTPWAMQMADVVAQDPAPLPPGLEAIAIAMGLLGPALLALSVAKPGWRRVSLVAGALLLAVTGTTVSTALNFGPEHAWAWLTPATLPGLSVGLMLALLACLAKPRACAAMGLGVLTALIFLMADAPADPYVAQSLLAWEQGRFIHFYGLAQWIGWCWPFASLVCLLGTVARRD